MNLFDAYIYCPICGKSFLKVGSNPKICENCHFELFESASCAVEACILNDSKKILLAMRKHNPHRGQWDIPGGFIESGENLEEALHREIHEELAVSITVPSFIDGFTDLYEYKGYTKPVLRLFYSATISEGTISPHDDVEDFQWVSLDQAATTHLAFASSTKAVQKLRNLI